MPDVVSLALAYELEAVCAVLSTGHILTVDVEGHDRCAQEKSIVTVSHKQYATTCSGPHMKWAASLMASWQLHGALGGTSWRSSLLRIA